ncbi:MAG: dihydroxy-acid dehydratase, partial [Deltaproteobacteria bacterium]|nr:dihydroxy-acid dehydratase [Deltaproteobacteria bacterium]
MKANIIDGKKRHPIEGFAIVGQVKAGKMGLQEAEEMLPMMACGAGSCVGLYTANTMAVVTEVLGMSLKRQQAYETGKKIVEIVKKGLRPRDIMTPQAFENAIRVDMAMGGSTNAVLHIPAVAKEAGVDIDVDLFDKISRQTPHLCSIIPAGPCEMADIDGAGGVPAVLKRLRDAIKQSPTLSGPSITEIAETAEVLDDDVIRPIENPYHKEGGIAVLKGNIANSSVIKQTAVDPEMLT